MIRRLPATPTPKDLARRAPTSPQDFLCGFAALRENLSGLRARLWRESGHFPPLRVTETPELTADRSRGRRPTLRPISCGSPVSSDAFKIVSPAQRPETGHPPPLNPLSPPECPESGHSTPLSPPILPPHPRIRASAIRGFVPRPPAHSQRGVTLIELVVVLALLSILLLVTVPAIKTVFGVDLRQSSREMAATIRYVYEESVIRNIPMRLAYDLDRNVWWVEAADGPARIFRDRDAREAFEEYLAEKAESDAEVREDAERRKSLGPSQSDIMSSMLGDQDGAENPMAAQGMGGMLSSLFGGGGFSPGAAGGEYQPNRFTRIGDPDEDDKFMQRELPRGVRFVGAWTPQHEDVVDPLDEYELEAMLREDPEDQAWTIVYTHIFPGGYIEDTVVYLGDETGTDLMSITIEPLTARVQVTKGQAEVPDLRDREQRQ